MAGDMAVALGSATVDGNTLFAQNRSQAPSRLHRLRVEAGREHPLGDHVRIRQTTLPQVRRTQTVLGAQPHESWGYTHGVNDAAVAVGSGDLPTRLALPTPDLASTDLVRLALERSRSAAQAVDLLIEWVERHGLGDTAFLVASPAEAFLVETAGRHFVVQEIERTRAAGDLCTIRQNWSRISRGLAGHAIEQSWWPADGSKLDFAPAVGLDSTSGLRRWERATHMLDQQAGHIDVPFLRRLLADHYEGTPDESDPFAAVPGPVALCQHGESETTTASMVASLPADPERVPLAWCAFGPPCIGVYFPVFLAGELPSAFADLGTHARQTRQRLCQQPERVGETCEVFDRLQARFDQEAERFALESHGIDGAERDRRTTLFAQATMEEYVGALRHLRGDRMGRAAPSVNV